MFPLMCARMSECISMHMQPSSENYLRLASEEVHCNGCMKKITDVTYCMSLGETRAKQATWKLN